MAEATVLFHVSDLHFGQEDRAALEWFANEVAEHAPAGIVCTGDLTMRGRSREFMAAAEYLSSLGVPVSVEPGNHDMPYYWDPVGRLMRPYDRFRALHRAVHSELYLDGVAVIPLKTIARAQWRLNWSKGRVSERDLGDALAGLDARQDCALRLVACHHPLIEADTKSTASTHGGKRALAALARSGANAVLSGHVHDAFDKELQVEGRAMRLIGAGTLSERLRETRPSYNRLFWSADDGLRVSPQLLS